MSEFSLAILTCLWKRPEVSTISLNATIRQLKKLPINWKILCVGSEGKVSQEIAQKAGVDYTEYPNDPLGGKFNHGLLKIRGWNPDAVMVLGSDNSVTSGFIQKSVKSIQAGTDVTGCLDGIMIDTVSKKSIHWLGYGGRRSGEPLGSGRCYGGKLLERLDWKLWENRLNRVLDFSATTNCKNAKAAWSTFRLSPPDIIHIGIKSPVNLGGWHGIAKVSKLINTRDILDPFGGSIHEDIMAFIPKPASPQKRNYPIQRRTTRR